jgi:hypothetical protein
MGSLWVRPGVANAGPAGHLWPARTFEMVPEDFLTGSGRKFLHMLTFKKP